MFNFSSKTQVNKEFKVKDILRQMNASKEAKEEAKNITSITLRNVISSKTLNCEEDDEIKEIYIFEIELGDIVQLSTFIAELDKSIKLHTYYFLKIGDGYTSTMAYKQLSGIKVLLSSYFSRVIEEENIEIPQVNNVLDAYKFLLSYQTNIPSRRSETASEYISRINKVHKLDFQISKTKQGIIHEVQPKKKYEYNERLRGYIAERNQLIKGDE